MPTFYDLKANLHFPHLAGVVKRLEDLPALLDLNLNEAAAYEAAASDMDVIGIPARIAYRACRELARLHSEDAARIRQFIRSREVTK